MALPILRGVGGKSANATSAAVTAPTGISNGDLDIMFGEVPDAATLAITTDGGGSWTPMTGTPLGVTGGERLYVWWRIFNSATDSNPTLTQSSGDHFCAARIAYQTGTFDTSDPFEAEETGIETTSDTSFQFTTTTSTGGADRLVLCCATILRDNNTGGVPVMANANLTSLTSREDICTNIGNGGGLGVTEGALANYGAIGTWSNTYATASPKAYISFAIRPVANPQQKTITASAETGAAPSLSITHIHTLTITAVASTDAAQVFNVDKTIIITSLTESDAAQLLEFDLLYNVTSGIEADAAQSLNIDKSKTLTPATETDFAANPISVTITGVGDISEAQVFTVDKSVTVNASETDAAQALTFHRGVNILPNTELAEVQALSVIHAHTRTLTPATEIDLSAGSVEPPTDVYPPGPLHRTDVHGRWSFVRGPARLLVAEMNQPFPEQIGDIIVPSGSSTTLYDARPGWVDVGATKGGVTINKEGQEEVYALNQETGHIESHLSNWHYGVQMNVAEATLSKLRLAWGITDTVIHVFPTLTERHQGFGQRHKKQPRRLAILYQDRKTLKIRAFVFRRVFVLGNESSINYNKTGDQQVIPIQLDSVLSQEDNILDIRKRFFTVFEQK